MKKFVIILGIIIVIVGSVVTAGVIGYKNGSELPIGGTEIKTSEKIIAEE